LRHARRARAAGGRRREDDDRQPGPAPVLEADGQRSRQELMGPAEPAGRVAFWRYLVPNAFTAASLVFGVFAIQAAIDGRIIAAWWGLYGTLTDRLDGLAAKLLHGQSQFGVQFDSLADLVIFGVVPPTVFYGFFARRPELGWSSPVGRAALVGACVTFTVAAA